MSAEATRLPPLAAWWNAALAAVAVGGTSYMLLSAFSPCDPCHWARLEPGLRGMLFSMALGSGAAALMFWWSWLKGGSELDQRHGALQEIVRAVLALVAGVTSGTVGIVAVLVGRTLLSSHIPGWLDVIFIGTALLQPLIFGAPVAVLLLVVRRGSGLRAGRNARRRRGSLSWLASKLPRTARQRVAVLMLLFVCLLGFSVLRLDSLEPTMLWLAALTPPPREVNYRQIRLLGFLAALTAAATPAGLLVLILSPKKRGGGQGGRFQ